MKKLMIAAALVAMVTPVAAQQKAPETYTLTLTPAEMNVVGMGLTQRPYAEVSSLITKLNEQIKQQNEAASAPVPAPRPPEAPKN